MQFAVSFLISFQKLTGITFRANLVYSFMKILPIVMLHYTIVVPLYYMFSNYFGITILCFLQIANTSYLPNEKSSIEYSELSLAILI